MFGEIFLYDSFMNHFDEMVAGPCLGRSDSIITPEERDESMVYGVLYLW